jgi:hypothetical protein
VVEFDEKLALRTLTCEALECADAFGTAAIDKLDAVVGLHRLPVVATVKY